MIRRYAASRRFKYCEIVKATHRFLRLAGGVNASVIGFCEQKNSDYRDASFFRAS